MLILILVAVRALAQSPAPPVEKLQELRTVVDRIGRLQKATTAKDLAELSRVIAATEKQDLSEQERRVIVLARDLEQTLQEAVIGVEKEGTLGRWKVRAGLLTSEGAKHLGRPDRFQRFGFATYTVDGGWTLGIQFFEYPLPGEEKVRKPTLYLRGPALLKAGQKVTFTENTTGTTFRNTRTVNADGTIPIEYPFPGAASKVTWKFGKRAVTFELADVREVYEMVAKFRVPEVPPTRVPVPGPNSLPR